MTTAGDAIEHDVWRPFMRSYSELDADMFLSVYSRDLIRGGGPGGIVQGHAAMAAEARDFFGRVRGDDGAMSIEFRFTERLIGDGVASERGVFRLAVHVPDRFDREMFGAFHVFERIEEGRWRIVTDYDSDEGGTIGIDQFEAATRIRPARTVSDAP